MNNLRLDIYTKRKQIVNSKIKLDKRKFRAQMSYKEVLFLRLIKEIEVFNISEPARLANELTRVKNYQNLNFRLLIIVYLYFSKKNLDISLVAKNFNKDFEEELKNIESNNYFPKLIGKEKIFNFRQDFIMYLILIENMDPPETIISENAIDDYEPEEYEEKIDENMTEVMGFDV